MQLKKSPRGVRYPDSATRYENESFGVEQAEDYGEFQPEPIARRQPRPGAAPQAGGDDPSAADARSESLVDRHSSFDGRYETDHDLRVEGSISGEVLCRGILTIEREASARARIQARDAQIRGRLEGDIVCSGRLLLAATAVVTGTIKATTLVVEEGASLSGTVDTTQKSAKPEPSRPAVVPPATGPIAEQPVVSREPVAAAGPRTARREVPSFAIVSSEERSASERH
ncbi:MAG: polymer-forming cytoskeletal protein [Dehalococcoidia bacterium]|nr:polymer-forming cytoskeletal protein [Dehalococcoidia bacterium]